MSEGYKLNSYNLGQITDTVFGNLVAESELPKGSLIIDAGCGSGRNTVYLASKGYRLLSVDISKSALDSLKKRSLPGSLEVMVCESDLNELGIRSQVFDAAVAWRVLHIGDRHKRKASLNEICRVLKNGAPIILAISAAYGKIFEERISKCEKIEENTVKYPSQGYVHVKHYFSEMEIFDFLKHFQIARVKLFESHSGHTGNGCQYYWGVLAFKEGKI